MFAGKIRAMALVGLFLSLACCGCGGGGGPSRAAIQGKVTLAGHPLKSGRVFFTPLAPNQGPVATALVVDGNYTLTAADGPVVGKNQVRVEATPDLGFALDDEEAFVKRGKQPLPPDPIPPPFGSQSTQTCEVTRGGENRHDIAIP